jgi:hypothetical protein
MSLHKVGEAWDVVQRAQTISNTDWLAQFHLSVVYARLEAERGNAAAAKRKLDAFNADAKRVGCVSCQIEVRSAVDKSQNSRTRVIEGHIIKSAHQDRPSGKRGLVGVVFHHEDWAPRLGEAARSDSTKRREEGACP